MSDLTNYLQKVRLQDFLSLHSVELPLKPLTVLVGPNGSGKSNVLEALKLLRKMIEDENPPSSDFIKTRIWAGGADQITIHVEASLQENMAGYTVTLQPQATNRVAQEKLIVNGLEVLSIENGQGQVKDEDRSNQIAYKSPQVALKSAGDYGNKPVTNKLREFIRHWEFYDFAPYRIRYGKTMGFAISQIMEPASQHLDSHGTALPYLLSQWHENAPDHFQAVQTGLAHAFNAKVNLDAHSTGNGRTVTLLEGYPEPIPLIKASDGTLLLLAYQVLLNQPEVPSLIAIEEPEKNFHPAWLNILSDILQQLSKRTQVIITTHSSQLLDNFAPESLQDHLSVLLLRNIPALGTEVIPLNQLQNDREELKMWIEEFGIGSAIFDSELRSE
ncbi:MAG: AAA family ATPase [Ardenticatenaceae bacterium]